MRALIFDFDGIVIDSERLLADLAIEAAAELGASLTLADIGHLFGSTESDHLWEELLMARLGRAGGLAELEALVTPRLREGIVTLPLMPGVAALLETARQRGLATALATGHDPERLGMHLTRLGLTQSFDAIVTSDTVALGKPAPDIYLAVAARLDVAPHECLVLEDSVPGCEAALAAGMRVIACPTSVSAHCEYPAGISRVVSLVDVDLAALSPELRGYGSVS
jgi:HAD superfamily hydrolase (TIGR01509 family)